MSKPRKPAIDPTMPPTPIEIDGTTYNLCFDLAALAVAETELNRQGHNVNILACLPVLNLANTRTIFACAIRKYHPELSYEDALELVNIRTLYFIAIAISKAWEDSIPEQPKNGSAAEAS